MAPVEFEKELKKRLRSREARPGEDAWERIAARLDSEVPGRRRQPLWRMGLVAASIALLATLFFFWEPMEPLPATEQVVEAPAKEAMVPGKKQEAQPIRPEPESGQELIVHTPEKRESELFTEQGASNPEALKADPIEGAIASLREPAPEEDSARMEGLDQQLDSVYSGILALEQTDQPVSDAQIDSLLWDAQRAIASQESLPEQPSVASSVLLAQVEDELDLTFREKIMEKVKSGVTRIRTAVAQNNK